MVESSEARADVIWLNLMLIGSPTVGKTSVIVRHTRKKFDRDQISTACVDFIRCEYTNSTGHKCRFKIWDTAGQERYRSQVDGFYKNADAVIVTFALNSKKSFLELRDWISSVRKEAIPESK